MALKIVMYECPDCEGEGWKRSFDIGEWVPCEYCRQSGGILGYE